MDKWLDMLGLYDFLGVICPGIFLMGSVTLIYNFNMDNSIEFFRMMIAKDGSIQIFVYMYLLVLVYVVGSFAHEMGHFCAVIHNIGLLKFIKIGLKYVVRHSYQSFVTGNDESEKLFLVRDFANSSYIERNSWFNLMQKKDFGDDCDDYNFSGTLQDNICNKNQCRNLKKASAAFYQHCKRVIDLNGFSSTSKKKESIYGFSRNIGFVFIFLEFILLLMVISQNMKTDTWAIGYQMSSLFVMFVVFREKSIRYKNMEVIDTIRTYRYIASNKNVLFKVE